MCNLYQLTSSEQAIRALFRAMEGEPGPLPPDGRVYPGRAAPLVVAARAGRALATMFWGVQGPRSAGSRPVTNVRNLESPFWRPLLGQEHRALVPASAFAEWSATPDPATGRKRQHWFALAGRPLFAFAGLFRAADDGGPLRFAFLTCAPNAQVAAVHPKAMPVILLDDAADAWLMGVDARTFQQPLAEGALVERIVEGRTG
jgi:putative SOS response-associated peptidase YedK